MNVAAMVAVVIAFTQAAKEFLRQWLEIKKFLSIILVIIISAGVVLYSYSQTGVPFELWGFLMLVAEVAGLAIGSKLVAGSIARKVNK
jgi:4-amino-4-deoxy-L-arabinose transferase-like glycosyltransferase